MSAKMVQEDKEKTLKLYCGHVKKILRVGSSNGRVLVPRTSAYHLFVPDKTEFYPPC